MWFLLPALFQTCPGTASVFIDVWEDLHISDINQNTLFKKTITKKIACSIYHTQFQTDCRNLALFQTKMVQNYTLFQIKMTLKPYPLGPNIPIYNPRQNCWDTLEWKRSLTLKTTYHNKSVPLSPLSMLLCHQNSPDETSVLPNNIDWGEGGGKAFLQSFWCFNAEKLRNTCTNCICLDN